MFTKLVFPKLGTAKTLENKYFVKICIILHLIKRVQFFKNWIHSNILFVKDMIDIHAKSMKKIIAKN